MTAAVRRPPASRVSEARGIIADVPPPTTPIVGRDEELRRVAAALADDGTTGVLVTGDAGVGKTRLVAEAVARATAAGARVLTGHCVHVGSETLPYLPFVEVLGRWERADPERVAGLAAASPALSALLPGGTASGVRVEAGELFEAVLASLVDLGRDGTVLLVVEDAHWADGSTRDLLGFLLTRLSDSGCRALVTVRTDDLDRRHPLRPLLAEWSRLPGVTRVGLNPLPADAMRRLVTAHHRGWLASEAVERIVEKSGGNPFFAEQLTVEADHGETLPADLADLLLLHVERLSPDARRAVRVAAVAGRRVSHRLLGEVAALPDVDAALREAVDAHVLVAAGGDDYEFRHALLAEAVYDDLLPGERVRLHEAFARALEATGGPDRDPARDADLARHAAAAHDLPVAHAAAVRAGAAALRLGAPTEALALFETALGTATRVPGADVVALTLQTAEAASVAGEPYRALALVESALEQPGLEMDQRVALLTAAARHQTALDEPRDPTVHSTAALALLPEEPPTEARARALMAHAHGCAITGRPHEAIRWATEALTAARALRLPAVVADATTTLARASARVGETGGAERLLEESIASARAAGDPATEIRGWHGIGGLLFERGDLAGAADAYVRGAQRATEAGRPWAPYALDCRLLEVLTRVQQGRLDDALARADVTGEAAPPYAQAGMRAVALGAHVARGDDHAGPLLEAVLPWTERDGFYAYSAAAASIELAPDAAAAVAAHDEWVERLRRLWQETWFAGRVRLAGLVLDRLEDEVAVAERLAAGARRAAAEVVVRQLEMGPEGRAWLARVEAELLRVRWRDGRDAPPAADLVTAWRTSTEAFGYGAHHEQTRSRVRLAEALTALGDPAAAEVTARAAADARAMGAAPLLSRLAVAAPPATGPVELTPRERQVLELIAEGRSNRQIGQRLYITDKTVSVHVSNILAKLGAGGRTEAAAIARRDGLL